MSIGGIVWSWIAMAGSGAIGGIAYLLLLFLG